MKQLLAKLRSLWCVNFVLPILFVLTLASGRVVVFRNVVFSILVFSTKNKYSSFLKKVFVFHKICFKVILLKTFKISSGSHIKTSPTPKRRAVSRILTTVFQKNLCSFCWFQNETSKKKRFLVLRQKPIHDFGVIAAIILFYKYLPKMVLVELQILAWERQTVR